MTDQKKPRTTLSLGRKPESDAPAEPTIQRSRKRIIKRDELPASKLAKVKPKAAPPKGRKPAKKPANKPKPIKSPSDLRAEELNASLNAFPVWRDAQPLAHGIEREIFQHIAKHSLSASKKVVQKLLYRHTRRQRYLEGIKTGNHRYHLDGSEAGEVMGTEQEHAGRALEKRP